MGHRLTAIVTRTGDDGTTGLGDGTRVPKDAARVAALGDVDELNSTIGLLRAERLPQAIDTELDGIQNDLLDLGGELSIPGFELLSADRVVALDEALAHHNRSLPRLREFVLPGGARSAALAHVARTVCRRAERSVVAIGHAETGGDDSVRPLCRQYLNRLGDLLFVLARTLNRVEGSGDVMWRRARGERTDPMPVEGRLPDGCASQGLADPSPDGSDGGGGGDGGGD